MQTSIPYISGQLEYIEKNLNLLKKEVSRLLQKSSPVKSLFGSLSKSNLTFRDFKKARSSLSSSWEQKWK